MLRRYASHHLQVGQYIVPSVLVEVDEEYNVKSLSPFVEEVANTIFVDGTLYLELGDYPSEDTLHQGNLLTLSLDSLIIFVEPSWDTLKLRFSN